LEILRSQTSISQILKITADWLKNNLNAEEVYIGRKIFDAEGKAYIYWYVSSKHNSAVVEKFESEENGVTFDALKEIEDPQRVDADGNQLAHSPPKFIQVENVLREPRMKFYGVPKLGAYLSRAQKYKSYLHADVYKEGDEPNFKEEWIVFSCDTMGQARSFTKEEIDSFCQITAEVNLLIETLEKSIYLSETEKKTQRSAELTDFKSKLSAKVGEEEKSVASELESIVDELKEVKEHELRALYLTNLLLDNVELISSISSNLIPYPKSALAAFASALSLLGYGTTHIFNPATKAPSWDKTAVLLNSSTLESKLRDFSLTDVRFTSEATRILGQTTKSDAESSCPVAGLFFTWAEAVIAYYRAMDSVAKQQTS
jgi:hypothetical protein